MFCLVNSFYPLLDLVSKINCLYIIPLFCILVLIFPNIFWFVFTVVLVIICTSTFFSSLVSSEETPLLCLLFHKIPKAYEEHKVLHAATGQARLYKYNLLSLPIIIIMIHFASAEFHVLIADVASAWHLMSDERICISTE